MADQINALIEKAKSGDTEAQFNLGIAYYVGHGVKADLEEAAQWYRKAAEQGHAKAQFNLGIAYYFSWGIERSLEEAAQWWRKAADQGLADAQCNLGNAYSSGEGVEVDQNNAWRWLRKSFCQGNENALRTLNNISSKKSDQIPDAILRLHNALFCALFAACVDDNKGDPQARERANELMITLIPENPKRVLKVIKAAYKYTPKNSLT